MRIIRIYGEPISPYIDVGEWWSTIRSGEEYKYVAWGMDKHECEFAIGSMKAKCKKLLGYRALQYMRNIMWLLSAMLFIMWPVVGHHIADDVQLILFCMVGAGFAWMLSNFLMTLGKIRWLGKWVGKGKIEVREQDIGAPVVAWRREEPQKPLVSLSRRAFIIMMALNCFILATPQYPAVIDGRVIEQVTLTYPGSQWEVRSRVNQGSVIAYYSYDEETSTLWTVRLSYKIILDDLTIDPERIHDWLQNVHSSYMSNITTQVRASIPDLEEWEFRGYFQDEVWPEIVEGYRSSLAEYVGEVYPGIRIIPVLTLEEMSVKEYQKEMQR